jgi:TolB-like protein/Tfp pilus assembly protein PilF
MRTFLEELKKRRVYRMAIAYGIAGSAVVQLAGTVFPIFHAPEWTQQVFVVLVALGFPVALTLAWAFDIEGGAITRIPSSGGSVASRNSRRMWLLGGAGGLIALVALTAYWFWHPWNRIAPVASSPGSEAVAPATVPAKSIAVLPFENFSEDKQNSSFIDGVQEEILTTLAKVADLKVISRTSVSQYKASAPRNLKEIAKLLGVVHILEGSVQRDGGRVRVTAQLVDARTDTHVWAEHYDRELADVFAIQSELAEQIVSQLQVRLSSAEKAVIEERPTSDIQAYDRYVRARKFADDTVFNARSEANLLEAARLLGEAIARDPKFLLAYCALAGVHDRLYFYGIDHTPERLALANAAVRTALQLRPQAGETHLAMAAHLYYGYLDCDGARRELDLARAALPNEAFVFGLGGFIARRQGRWEEAAHQFERSLEVDPRNVNTLEQVAFLYQDLRRYADMATALDRALAIVPDKFTTRVQRAMLELDWRAQAKPLHETLQATLSARPEMAGELSDAWLVLALCERDPVQAERALAALAPEGCRDQRIAFPRAWCEGQVAQLKGDREGARRVFESGSNELDKIVRNQPAYAEGICALGVLDAALGRKEKAIAEGRRAVALLPVTKDSINGALAIQYLALIYASTGEKELALDQLETVIRLPGVLSYGLLRLHPIWDRLRGDARFEKMVASLAPKD